MQIPTAEKISKCQNRQQLRHWLEQAREELEAVNQEISEAISQGRHQHHPPDRRFFDRMYRMRKERGKQIHALNTRLHRLHEEPDMSFEEYLLDWIRDEIGREAFDRMKEAARARYREEIMGELETTVNNKIKAS